MQVKLNKFSTRNNFKKIISLLRSEGDDLLHMLDHSGFHNRALNTWTGCKRMEKYRMDKLLFFMESVYLKKEHIQSKSEFETFCLN